MPVTVHPAPANGTSVPTLVEPPAVGTWVKPAASSVGTSSGVSNGQARWVPLWLPPGTYDGMLWDVTGAGSVGAAHRGVLYLPGANGDPLTLALDTGSVSAETVAVKRVTGITSPLVLTKTSLVWGSVIPQGAPATQATLRAIGAVAYQQSDPYPFLQNYTISRFTDGITGAPPATLPSVSRGAANSLYNFAVRRSA